MGRRMVALAFPALGVLAAEPIYLLLDTAIVGRLGAVSLAGLAVGGLIVAMVSSQLTFLVRHYRPLGPTPRGRQSQCGGSRGVQATWLALGLGVLITITVELVALPLVSAIAGTGGGIAAAALPWLRIAVLAVPAILVSMAGNGWMRGVQDTVRPLRYVLVGFAASAVLCPLLVYGWLGLPRWGWPVRRWPTWWDSGWLRFCSAGHFAERVPLRLDFGVLRAQAVTGRDLVLRTMAFQACFVSAAAVAARFGAAALAAHQVVLQLWTFLALVLDSLAIAAQSLVELHSGAVKCGRPIGWHGG